MRQFLDDFVIFPKSNILSIKQITKEIQEMHETYFVMIKIMVLSKLEKKIQDILEIEEYYMELFFLWFPLTFNSEKYQKIMTKEISCSFGDNQIDKASKNQD